MTRFATFGLVTLGLIFFPWMVSYVLVLLFALMFPVPLEIFFWGVWIDVLYGVSGGGFFHTRLSTTILFGICFLLAEFIRRYTRLGRLFSRT